MRIVSLKGILAAVAILIGLGVLYAFVRNVPEAPKVTIVADTAPTRVHTVIGTTLEGRNIDAYTFGTGPKKLLFVGGVHGGYEWNSVVLAYEFKNYLATYPRTVPESMSITVIPSLNVDGTYAVVGKEGEFTEADISSSIDTAIGRVNANGVDLNRNFDCKWQSSAVWRSAPIGAGTGAFSEPESTALRDYILKTNPDAVIFWHSQSGSVYASECEAGVLPETLDVMHAYASAAGYGEVKSFDAYPVTGDAEGWLASIGIPAITVELTNHTGTEWKKNLAGLIAVLEHFSK